MKKNKIKNIGEKIVYSLVLYGIPILLVAVVVGVIILRLYCFFTYGDKPITEVPSWVWWVMNSGNGGK